MPVRNPEDDPLIHQRSPLNGSDVLIESRPTGLPSAGELLVSSFPGFSDLIPFDSQSVGLQIKDPDMIDTGFGQFSKYLV